MKLVFASANANKIEEIQHLLPPSISLVGLPDVGITAEIPETADTIEGNAILKAKFVVDSLGLSCFADDTGLEVAALHGAPGVKSARFAGEAKSAAANIKKLLHDMQGKLNRDAQFVTVIALYLEGQLHLFKGVVQGTIVEEPRGVNGFGYDPVFLPKGFDKTFAEMDLAQKSLLSHRGHAVKQLINFLKRQ
jgi:XTP/dITP diphosphohydrolase